MVEELPSPQSTTKLYVPVATRGSAKEWSSLEPTLTLAVATWIDADGDVALVSTPLVKFSARAGKVAVVVMPAAGANALAMVIVPVPSPHTMLVSVMDNVFSIAGSIVRAAAVSGTMPVGGPICTSVAVTLSKVIFWFELTAVITVKVLFTVTPVIDALFFTVMNAYSLDGKFMWSFDKDQDFICQKRFKTLRLVAAVPSVKVA